MEDIIARLNQVPLFASLSRASQAELAAIVKRVRYPQGAIIARQGELGTTLFIINSGQIVAMAVDERGEPTPPRYLGVGDWWGETSLLIGEPRDATMQANSGVELLAVEKADFDRLAVARPDIWRGLAVRPEVQLKLAAPHFPWLAKGERVEWFGGKHWIVLVRNSIIPLGMWIVAALGMLLVQRYLSWSYALVGVAGFSALILPWIVWNYVDWRNDYHIITNRRVVHVEKVLLQYESRDEAPLDKIQNIFVRRDAPGSSLGYAHIRIVTASARGGWVEFLWVTQPELVVKVLTEQVRRFRLRQRTEESQQLVRILRDRLSPVKEETEESGQPLAEPEARHDVMSLLSRGQGCSSAITDSAFYSFIKRPHMPRLARVVENGHMIWRKHWVILLWNVFFPAVLLLALLVLTAWGMWRPYLGLQRIVLLALALPLLALVFFWLAWRYEDWRNDLYVVTDTQIIDIERTPFLFYETRRQANLENIQDIRFEKPSFWASIFNIGHVLIQTAGQGQFTFNYVYDPSSVQKEIFRRIEALQERRREAERKRREAELADWFAAYDEMQHQ